MYMFPRDTCFKWIIKLDKSKFAIHHLVPTTKLQTTHADQRNPYHDVYSNAWGGWGSSSMAMAVVDAGVVLVAAVEGVTSRTSSTALLGLRSRRRTNPEGAALTGSYLLPCRNFMNFSWAGMTRAGLDSIWNVASGSGDFFSAAASS
jgi:hypothetical protein